MFQTHSRFLIFSGSKLRFKGSDQDSKIKKKQDLMGMDIIKLTSALFKFD